MVYRNDVDALEARLSTIQSELDAKTRDRDEAARLVSEARARANNDQLAADWAAGGPQRRRNQRIAVVIAGVFAVTASIGLFVKLRGPSAKQQRLEAVITQFEAFTDDMCRCKDTQCATGVSDQMSKWAMEMAKEEPSPSDFDEATQKRVANIGERMGKCMTTAMTPPEPAAESFASQAGGNGNAN